MSFHPGILFSQAEAKTVFFPATPALWYFAFLPHNAEVHPCFDVSDPGERTMNELRDRDPDCHA